MTNLRLLLIGLVILLAIIISFDIFIWIVAFIVKGYYMYNWSVYTLVGLLLGNLYVYLRWGIPFAKKIMWKLIKRI